MRKIDEGKVSRLGSVARLGLCWCTARAEFRFRRSFGGLLFFIGLL